WVTEEMAFHSLKADRAKSTARYFALDPDSKVGGDWGQLIGTPCMVTLTKSKSKKPGSTDEYNNISAVSSMRPREAAKAPELVNPAVVFDFYHPDMELFEKFPDWIKEKMKEALDYEGSPLEEALSKSKPSLKSEKIKEEEDTEQDQENS